MKNQNLNPITLKKVVTILTGVICFNLAIAQSTYNFYPSQTLTGNNNESLDYQSNNSSFTKIRLLDREGSTYGTLYGAGDGSKFGLLDGDNNWSYFSAKDDYTAFRINNVERMRIEDNGYVGIGTNDPQQTLHVDGNAIIGSNNWGALTIDGKDRNDWLFNAHNSGNKFFIRTQRDNGEADQSFYVMTIVRANGNVGIGTEDPQHKLDVCGVIRANEVIVEDNWCDFVFEPEYCLTTLEEEEAFIKLYGHLSNFESAKAMNGEINVNDIFKRQQIQIEENVLHLIELNEENNTLQIQVNDLTDNVEQLTAEVTTLKTNYEALAKELADIKAQLK